MSRRRLRSGAMHADTEQEYLQKLQSIEKQHQLKSPYGQFAMNDDFCFGSMEVQVDMPTNIKNHMILLMSDDMRMTYNRLGELLVEHYRNSDNNFIYDMDCFVYQKVMLNITHQYTIWIQNTNQANQWFQTIYYPKFEHLFIIAESQYSQAIGDIVSTIQQLNHAINIIHCQNDLDFKKDLQGKLN